MWVYEVSLATAGNFTTNATAATEMGVYSTKPGLASVGWQSMSLIGKGAGLTAISGIGIRLCTFTTASTSGTAANASPARILGTAATQTSVSGQTISSTGRQNTKSFGCGAAGPGGWVVPNEDSMVRLQGSSVGSIDTLDVSGTVSLVFEASCETVEF